MALDIMPWQSPRGGHDLALVGEFDSNVAYNTGDLVFRNDAGQWQGFPADDTAALLADMDSGLVCGIALGPPEYSRGNSGNGTAFTALTTNWRTGTNFADGDFGIPVIPADRGNLFITTNYRALIGSVNTAAIPPGAIRGEAQQLAYDNTNNVWAVVGTAGVAGTDVIAIVHDVLDANKETIAASDTTTGDFVVFEINTNLGV